MLSIFVPTYNRQHMLPKCLESLRATTVDCEILVYDDASTDGTQQLMERLAKEDPRLRYFRQDVNRGAAANFKYFLEEARGEFLGDMADDDWALPGCYEKKVAILEAHPEVGFVYSFRYLYDEASGTYSAPRRVEHLNYSYIGGRNEFLDLLPGNYIMANGMVYRRSLLERVGAYDDTMPTTLSDWELWLRLSWHAQTAYINEPLAVTRQHGSRLSTTEHADTTTGMIAVWRKWLVQNETPPVIDDRMWQRMYDMFLMCLNMSFAGNQPAIADWLNEFQLLRADYTARITERFAVQSRPLAAALTSEPATAAAEPPAIWQGPLSAADGLGDDLRALLGAHRVPPRLEDVTQVAQPTGLSEAEWQPLRRGTWTRAPERRYVLVRSASPRYLQPDPLAAASIGRVAVATEGMPAQWIERCNAMDYIWAPSEFSCERLASSGVRVDKLRVLPGCIDVAAFGEGVAPAPLNTGRSFTFLTVCEWNRAAGWDVLLHAWSQAFKPDDDVALALCTYSYVAQPAEDIAREIREVLSASGSGQVAPIQLNIIAPADRSLAARYRAAQAYVEAGRAEAWGRRLMEAMASGLPCIAPRWGGHLGFASEDICRLVDCELADIPMEAAGADPALKGQRWGEPAVEHLRGHMRLIVQDRKTAEAMGARARARLVSEFSPTAVGRRLAELYAEAGSEALALAAS